MFTEDILTEILARLPLRSISRFKSVCKTWKSTTETNYFRRLFVSLHKNSSSSWSLLMWSDVINLHRCETWDLPKSLACCITSHVTGKFTYMASSSGLVCIHGYSNNTCFVGNPVLQQWVRIPSSPDPYANLSIVMDLLVTRVDEDGVVLAFKLVKFAKHIAKRQESMTSLYLLVYSSETGVWSEKRLDCLHYYTSWAPAEALNGTLYISPSGYDGTDDPAGLPGVLIAHDLYGESDRCRVIPLPDHDPDHNRFFKRTLTTSSGSVMYIKTLPHSLLKVWMLTKNDDWQLLWESRLPFITCDDDILYYAPLAMNPFDPNLVYLWSQQHRHLVSCNLQTQSYQIMREDDESRRRSIDDDDGLGKCFVNQSACEMHMNIRFEADSGFPITLFISVLPRWMESLPCPPQVEMMDKSSLLSCLLQMEDNRPKIRDTK
ncbi:unnamed protein product [Microthlaspi erraticum]|uniref:F-box domain-containing protein n=1 Tax=Microthlaspi erraticum TaxID=1685480 RepID=A0A6D2JZ73_9BRAS|nr:unnamed protein product [Microthlaspi erraticum]